MFDGNIATATEGSGDYREIPMRPVKPSPSVGYLEFSSAKEYTEFRSLAAEWLEETGPLSSITRITTHPAYMSIIAMGPRIIPWLLDEVERNPNHWFTALKVVARVDPVPPEDRGNLERMVAAWLGWGQQNDFI